MIDNKPPLKKIGEICTVIAGQSPVSKYYNKKGEGLPFYQGKKEFTDKYIGKPTTWTTQVTKEAFKNDILMSVRAPVGPINFATQKICIGRGLAAIRPGENVDPNYLFYFLKNYQDKIIGNNGAVFNSINKQQIMDIQLPLPSIREQKSVVEKLDKISSEIKQLKSITQQKLSNLEELNMAILKKTFESNL